VLIAQIGRLDAGFGEGREFDVIAAAVLGGASLFGGIGSALGAVAGATLIQTVKTGLVFTGREPLPAADPAGRDHLPGRVHRLAPEHRMRQLKRRTIRPLGEG
jgi:hypothetical protein